MFLLIIFSCCYRWKGASAKHTRSKKGWCWQVHPRQLRIIYCFNNIALNVGQGRITSPREEHLQDFTSQKHNSWTHFSLGRRVGTEFPLWHGGPASLAYVGLGESCPRFPWRKCRSCFSELLLWKSVKLPVCPGTAGPQLAEDYTVTWQSTPNLLFVQTLKKEARFLCVISLHIYISPLIVIVQIVLIFICFHFQWLVCCLQSDLTSVLLVFPLLLLTLQLIFQLNNKLKQEDLSCKWVWVAWKCEQQLVCD